MDYNLLEKISKIYKGLQDEVSKKIFFKRLQYSLSSDEGIISEMVYEEMMRCKDTDIMMSLLLEIEKTEQPIIIWGAGFAGHQIANMLEYMGRKAECFVDNNSNLWGKVCCGLEIRAPKSIKDTTKYFIIIGTNYFVAEIHRELMGMGIAEENIFVPDKQWWIGNEPQYFDSEIMHPDKNECFVDGGSFDGENTLEFISWCAGNFSAVYMFEPDKENYLRIKTLAEKDNKILAFERGLWSDTTVLRFSSRVRETSTISDKGDVEIKVTSIDEILNGKPVTFIKLDIEGSEMEAIKGAEKTIKLYKPKLAICVYHKPEDIIDIPLKILEMNPSYKLFLRHYSYLQTETVLYAVE